MEENVNQTEKEMAENEKQKQAEKAVRKQKSETGRNNPGTDRTAGGRANGKRSLE